MRLLPLFALLACGAKDPEPAPTTFTEVRDELLLKSCALSSCHGSGTGDLSFDAAAPDAVYSALVDVPSAGAPGFTLVVPGDPDNSYLVMKLEAHADIVDDPMPPPFGLLDQDPEMVDRVRSWIADGAPDN